MLAFVLISTEIGSEREVLEELKKIDEVKEAYVVFGVYDIVAKVVANNVDDLKGIVSNKIRRIGHVKTTLTMIVAEGFVK
ncbi:MAG: Lrp/AsnC family transcriptional regulator [Thermoprotei archaeon]|nr:MAG: Lrp/AsnC family transcriptional regulator [Thermoprotei archaeon]